MTLTEIFDALNGRSFTYLVCKDGSKFGGTPLRVNFCSNEELEPACLQVTPEGLVLHFNSNGPSGMRGETINLADILTVN